MAIKARGEMLELTDQVNLTIQFRDGSGNPVDTDTFPQVSIVQPSGGVLITPTTVGVTKVSTGKYSYLFTIPLNGPYGVFNDIWVGYVGGVRVESVLSFVVSHTDLPAINSDGYLHLGDDPGFNYSQTAIANINNLLKMLRARLNSSGKSYMVDKNGNPGYVDCDIYSIDMLVTFLASALVDFNQVPYFTFFTFDDAAFVAQFGQILVEGATLHALASKALIERGREFQFTDNGVSFNPPSVAEMLNTQYSALLTHYFDKLKLIKNSLRPGPLGLGVFGMNQGMSPAVRRLRHLRARRII